jgi:BioD-like phosphotransacetylase family protein
MARKIFIAATGMNGGKTTTSLSLMHMARKKYPRVGFVKPIGPKIVKYGNSYADKDAVLIAQYFNMTEDLSLMSPFVLQQGDTRRIMDGEIRKEEASEKIFSAIKTLDSQNDFLIIEGAGHTGVGTIFGCSNARIASEAGAPVLLVTGGGLGNVVDMAAMNLALFQKEQAEVKAILVNKIMADKREQTLGYLRSAFQPENIEVIGGFNYQTILANPTLRRVAKVLDLNLRATDEEAQRIVDNIQIGAASCQRVVEMLTESSLIIVNSSRDELLVTLANLYQLPDYRRKIAGIVIPGVCDISHVTQQIVEASGIPYIRCGLTASRVFELLMDDVSKLTAEDTQKLNLIVDLAEKHFDFDAIDALLTD